LLQFTPYSFEIWNWAIFESPKRFLQALALVAVELAFELNAFFLKTLLWIPPPHPVNISRLVLLWLLALPSAKEYHTFLEVCQPQDANIFGSKIDFHDDVTPAFRAAHTDMAPTDLQGQSQDVFSKLGSYAWLACAILAMEILNIIKLGQGEFTAPFPASVQIAWSITGGFFVLGMLVWQISIWVSKYRRNTTPLHVKRE
jgi:phosphatidylserine synthase 2